MRVAGKRLLAIAALAAVTACGMPFEAFRVRDAFERLPDADPPAPSFPQIAIVLQAAGGDAVDVYFAGGDPLDRSHVAELVAQWLGVDPSLAELNDFHADAASIQLDRRLARRAGDRFVLALDTAAFQESLSTDGRAGFELVVCHAGVETRFRASRPADEPYACDLRGRAWNVGVGSEPLRVEIALLPDAADYLLFVAALALGLVVLSALAWLTGDRLRRGPFRQRSAASVAIGLVGGGLLTIGLGAAAAGIAIDAGPADNLVMARDYGPATYAGAVALPALVSTLPGIVFASLLARRRPWPEEREATASPAASPPPLPWNQR
jgi:hypothetical protein